MLLFASSLIAVPACSSNPGGVAGNEPVPTPSLAPAGEGREATTPSLPPSASRGFEFAHAHCSGCHAISAGRFSPNPDAPPFDSIINTPGLTSATLETWLHDSHNYPQIMNFEIEPSHIADLSSYMMTLVNRDFVPPAQ
jgi:mono/diheme cytochrome c family protein